MDHCLVPSVVASDIAVTSASGVLADQVAEHTIALITAWCRGLPAFFRAQQKREYIRRPTRDLTGATVGIVGLGGVGRRLAELLDPFRVRILATDMFPVDKPEGVEALWPAGRLDDLLAAADFLVLCLPLFDGQTGAQGPATGDGAYQGTRGIINAAAIRKMKPGALLVNVARGPLVVTADLAAALSCPPTMAGEGNSRGLPAPGAQLSPLAGVATGTRVASPGPVGCLAGAVLDVADPEPLPPDSPLWDLPNVIITPHVGGQSAWRSDRMTELFCQNLRRWRAGLPLVNFITDKHLGFPIRGGGYPLWGEG